MEQRERSLTLKTASFLFSYPDESFFLSFPDYEREIFTIKDPRVSILLRQFIFYIKNTNRNELQDNYIQTFDFGKKTNLYITYLKNGEQRERGMELLALKEFYKKRGFSIDERELPDYLPLMLEFSAIVSETDAHDLFSPYLPNLTEMLTQLSNNNSPYLAVMDAVMSVIRELERKRESVSVDGGVC